MNDSSAEVVPQLEDSNKLIAAAFEAQKRVIALESDLEEATEKRDGLRTKVVSLCKPHCEEAIRKCNEKHPRLQRVRTSHMAFSFFTEKEFHLHVRLGRSGQEPDEDMDMKEVLAIFKRLKPFVDEQMETAGIALSLCGISVPSSYYMK